MGLKTCACSRFGVFFVASIEDVSECLLQVFEIGNLMKFVIGCFEAPVTLG